MWPTFEFLLSSNNIFKDLSDLGTEWFLLLLSSCIIVYCMDNCLTGLPQTNIRDVSNHLF